MTNRELIAHIEKRPLAFISKYSLAELEAFISGYNFHRFEMGEHQHIDEDFKKFIDSWIYTKLDTTDKKGWKESILGSCNTEEEAFWRFFDLWNEYMTEHKS